MTIRIEEYPEVSKYNICPNCNDPNATILTPNGSPKSKCAKCNLWFTTRYGIRRITHDTRVEIID